MISYETQKWQLLVLLYIFLQKRRLR